MPAIHAHFGINRYPTPSALKTVAVVCLVLLALLAVAQVTHVHAVGSDADHCQLCIAMHSVVPFVVFVVAVLLVRIGNAAPTPLEDSHDLSILASYPLQSSPSRWLLAHLSDSLSQSDPVPRRRLQQTSIDVPTG